MWRNLATALPDDAQNNDNDAADEARIDHDKRAIPRCGELAGRLLGGDLRGRGGRRVRLGHARARPAAYGTDAHRRNAPARTRAWRGGPEVGSLARSWRRRLVGGLLGLILTLIDVSRDEETDLAVLDDHCVGLVEGKVELV